MGWELVGWVLGFRVCWKEVIKVVFLWIVVIELARWVRWKVKIGRIFPIRLTLLLISLGRYFPNLQLYPGILVYWTGKGGISLQHADHFHEFPVSTLPCPFSPRGDFPE